MLLLKQLVFMFVDIQTCKYVLGLFQIHFREKMSYEKSPKHIYAQEDKFYYYYYCLRGH